MSTRPAPVSDLTRLTATRESLHRVAEHVLAAAQFSDTGRIRLRPVPGGFETWDLIRGGERLRVIDGRLVVADATGERTAALSSVGAAARFAGAAPGLAPRAYRPATPFEPDAPLDIDPDSALVLAGFWWFADSALRRFADAVGSPAEPILWPEHFDVGITLDEVNYGGSPGDAAHPRPYLYVGPYDGPPVRDGFWNEPFGAARAVDEVRSAEEAVAFFEQGRSLATAGGRR